MMPDQVATIEYPNGVQATFDGDIWSCADTTRARRLNALYNVDELTALNTLAYHPNPIAEVAQWAAQKTGAKVVSLPETDEDEGTVY